MWFQKFKDSLSRIKTNFLLIILTVVFVCGPVYSLTWLFDLIDTLAGRISLTVLVSILPLTVAFTDFDAGVSIWRRWGEAPWLVAFFLLANGLAASDKFSWAGTGVHTVLLIVALPYCWIVWKLIGHNWLIWTALTLGIVEVMIYWVAALLTASEPDAWRLLLVPLPVVLFLAVVWAPISSLTLGIARRRKPRRISGPGFQALAMAVLFLPVILFAITVPGGLQLSQEWSAVSLFLAGILLSALVADPLRRFLLEWAGLWVSRP